jgi:hypothetical protein
MRLPHETLGGTLSAGLALVGLLSLVALWLAGG